jgi:hypothetical protein
MVDKTKSTVIKAIGELGRRVTPADVATKTGLPVLVVQQELNKVAMETKGNLQVGKTGDIVYSFAPGFTNQYLATGIAAAFGAVWTNVAAAMFYLLRISFGVALIASLIIIVVLLVVIAAVLSKGLSNSDSDNDSGFSLPDFGNIHLSFWDWMFLRDMFLWNSMTRGPVRYDYARPTIRERGRSNFLLNCFSFLFGDGNPNEGLDEKRWQVIAQVIKKHGNVVTAEQLAPYTGANPKDENAVLPVLVRFNGKPEVTNSGHIVYVFESLQTVAAVQNANPPDYLHEFPWRFTNVPEGQLLPVFIVAGLNLAGAWWLFGLVPKLGPEYAHSPLMTLVIALCVYGTLFVALPVVRHIANSIRNSKIEQRNDQRMRLSQALQRPEPTLIAKLEEARNYKVGTRSISDSDVVYTTEKDALDQPDELSDKFEELDR